MGYISPAVMGRDPWAAVAVKGLAPGVPQLMITLLSMRAPERAHILGGGKTAEVRGKPKLGLQSELIANAYA